MKWLCWVKHRWRFAGNDEKFCAHFDCRRCGAFKIHSHLTGAVLYFPQGRKDARRDPRQQQEAR